MHMHTNYEISQMKSASQMIWKVQDMNVFA